MAEEKETAQEGTEAPKKKGGKLKLIIIGAGIVILMGGGFIGWKVMAKKEVKAEGEHVEQKVEEEHGYMVDLSPFVVNLADSEALKYLKITISLEVDSEKTAEEIKTRMPQIRDALLMLLTSKSSEDIKDISGKLKLQDEMAARINTFLKDGKVKAVYFTEFVMQ